MTAALIWGSQSWTKVTFRGQDHRHSLHHRSHCGTSQDLLYPTRIDYLTSTGSGDWQNQFRLAKFNHRRIHGSERYRPTQAVYERDYSLRLDHAPRLFKITVPALPVFFSGTGDMFAALTVSRFRAAIHDAELSQTPRWQSPDSTAPADLPLAHAATIVLASMQSVLRKTLQARDAEVQQLEVREAQMKSPDDEEEKARMEKDAQLRRTKAAEVRVVRNAADLRDPRDVERFRAEELHVKGEEEAKREAGEEGSDELGC